MVLIILIYSNENCIYFVINIRKQMHWSTKVRRSTHLKAKYNNAVQRIHGQDGQVRSVLELLIAWPQITKRMRSDSISVLLKYVWLFCYSNFEKNCDIFTMKESKLSVEQKTKFWEKRNRIGMENPAKLLDRLTLCFNSYQNHKLKVKL